MNIQDYAAFSRNGLDWTEAFQHAIADLKNQGGGVLSVPAGIYPTGSIRLYDDMTLNIESGAVLRFHQDKAAFPQIALEFEGRAGLVYQACIYAEKAKNVCVTGYGTVDGQGSYVTPWLQEMSCAVQRGKGFCLLFQRLWDILAAFPVFSTAFWLWNTGHGRASGLRSGNFEEMILRQQGGPP